MYCLSVSGMQTSCTTMLDLEASILTSHMLQESETMTYMRKSRKSISNRARIIFRNDIGKFLNYALDFLRWGLFFPLTLGLYDLISVQSEGSHGRFNVALSVNHRIEFIKIK